MDRYQEGRRLFAIAARMYLVADEIGAEEGLRGGFAHCSVLGALQTAAYNAAYDLSEAGMKLCWPS